jgi:cobalt-zinc-cadmium efflux system outer membrane protein
MAPGSLRFLSAAALVLLLLACSAVPYSPRPLKVEESAAEFLGRSGESSGLKSFALANGYRAQDWPPAQWGLAELTLVALYFHPDLRAARLRAKIARAELAGAVQPQSWAGQVRPAYHSRALPDTSGPWTLGLELEFPLVAQHKRAALAERSAFLVDAAELDVASAAWLARSRLRDRFLELWASRDAVALAEAQLAARRQMLGMTSRRMEAGMLSARELAIEQLAVSQLEQALGQEASRVQRALGDLAAALGLPLDVLEPMRLRFDPQVSPGIDMDDAALRRLALRNRLDVHRRLLEFGAADSEVKLAVAAQNPDIRLGPGYAWDEGDNVWSLALGISLPSAAHAQASIREAQARRELAVEQFAATQTRVIGLTSSASAQYRMARERVERAQRSLQLQQQQESRIARQFDSGAADRMQRIAARIETLSAQAVLEAALVEQRQALAQLEDAVQRPLLNDSRWVAEARVQRSAAIVNDAPAGLSKP